MTDYYRIVGYDLSICDGIIEAHGGKIWVDKAPKTGATIKFTLPVSNRQAREKRIHGYESIVDRR